MPNRISNILFFLSKLPRSAWQLLLERRALRVSRTHNWRGFSLYDYEIYSNAAPPMSQLIEALELIERLDRRRFARIRRDLRGIMVRDGGAHSSEGIPELWSSMEAHFDIGLSASWRS